MVEGEYRYETIEEDRHVEAVKSGIRSGSATTIDWVKTPDELVAGIEEVFPAIKDREKNEEEILDQIWEAIEKVLEELPGGEEIAEWLKGVIRIAAQPFLAYDEANQEIKRKRSPMPRGGRRDGSHSRAQDGLHSR
jgi:hypothetical protein